MECTIMMPARNVEKFVSQSLESALGQTFSGEMEIVFIDDNSEDGTLEIAREYEKRDKRLRVISQKQHMGVGFTRNRLLDESKGRILASLDSDDVLNVEAIETVMNAFQNPGIGFVYTDQEEINEKGELIRTRQRANCHKYFDELIYHCQFPGHLRSFRAASLNGARFDPSLRTAEDWDFIFKIHRGIGKEHVPIASYQYRINGNGISLTQQQETIQLSSQLVAKYIKDHKIYDGDARVVPITLNGGMTYYDHLVKGDSVMNPEARKVLETYLLEGN